MNDKRMEKVPQHLRIKVLYEDEDIIVIDKPPNLRSVPGHANPPPASSSAPHDDDAKESRLAPQEAWIQALESFRNEKGAIDTASKWLLNLAMTRNVASVPRKWSTFLRYVQRSQRRLNPKVDTHKEGSSLKQQVENDELDDIARVMYERIKKRQIPLMNLPEATRHEESAFGQLILLGYAGNESNIDVCSKLFVVHRLDCQVS